MASIPLAPARSESAQGVRRDRGRVWLERLAASDVGPALGVASVLSAEVRLDGEAVSAFVVVPDAESRLPRARDGQMGLEQALALAACVRAAIGSRTAEGSLRPLLAIVDTPGQALGCFEEAHCLSAACAAAVEAYALARRAGHPVLTLVVGGAFSGSFLAHGLQSDAIVALEGDGVSMHAMGARSIARITRRTLADVEALAKKVLPMSYAIADAHRLGIVDELLAGVNADAPSEADLQRVHDSLAAHLRVARAGGQGRSLRGNDLRAATVRVHDSMRAQWAAADLALPLPQVPQVPQAKAKA